MLMECDDDDDDDDSNIDETIYSRYHGIKYL
jgi:hypothetical protein